ncbi:MAG: 16S rRNA (guanine(966)-N(2))-methyltransferase RsmD [Pyrinomonas sp.]|uniref:16S rRNA (guanine(966)-N(2))-methyltransferase RsmD n=1 Tax=Pyrinomonas sp. TaxID=2080306 RepID=UPI0033343620
MRVIGGVYRGRRLKSPPSLRVRPTADRLRETLFNVLAPRIQGVRFLDLCAGSGAVGIEALSRGASFATFVDRSRRMCALIEANLDLCGVPEEETEVFMSEAAEFLRRAVANGYRCWDVIFFDPPYAENYSPVLETLGEHRSLICEDGVVVVEHHHKKVLPDAVGTLRRWRILRQGDAALSFYQHD